MTPDNYPTYAELLQRTDAPPGSAWGMWGANDNLGALNMMTDQSRLAALGLVKSGSVVNLDYPLDAMPGRDIRPGLEHVITEMVEHGRDDYLNKFFLQASTQIDGLRHWRHFDYGFYDGVADEEIHIASSRLGIGAWAESGIVARGVLVDIERSYARNGKSLDFESGQGIEIVDLVRALEEQDVELRGGDVLLIRTGWCEYLLGNLDSDYVRSGDWAMHFPGLAQSREMVGWLWDHQVMMVAADNVALECSPPVPGTPFIRGMQGFDGYMHMDILALLGIPIGELWKLDELAAECAKDGRYDFMLIAKPLNLTAGVGSPANAIAIR